MTKASFAILALPALIALAACEDPAKDAPKATVSSAAPKPATAPEAKSAQPTRVAHLPGLDILALDPASTVGFVGSKVTGKHEGKFEKVSGTVALAGGKIEGGTVEVEVEVASVKTDSDKLDGHLKSADFFDAEKFPKATFKSTEIKVGGNPAAANDHGSTHIVTGELDLHGEKKTISFPATITVTADAVSGTAEFAINRKDFKIVYPGKPDDLIRDDVLLKLSFKAARKH